MKAIPKALFLLVSLTVALSVSVPVFAQSLEALQAQIKSIESCRQSLRHADCNLQILDKGIRDTLISIDQLNQQQAQIKSYQSCMQSLRHADCNLQILDKGIRDTLIQLDQLNQQRQTRQDFNAGTMPAQGCFDSTITSPSPFMGNSGEIFKLLDGTVGEVGAEYEYLYEYYPSVTVCPSRSILILKEKSLSISILSTSSPAQGTAPDPNTDRTPSLIESKIDDEFEGYDYGNIYRLRNGQIWEQTSETLGTHIVNG